MRSGRSGRSISVVLLLALLLVAGVVGALALAPAEGAFPGANGKIAFQSERDGDLEIYAMNADGSGQTNLTNDPGPDRFAAWSPDGSKLAFESNRDGDTDVYVMNADGSGQTDLTDNSAFDGQPHWSPDGSKLAFHSVRDGNLEIYVMNGDGSAQTNLTQSNYGEEAPAWSPDGEKLAFSSNRDGNLDVFVMNAADGSGQTNLTNDPGSDRFAAWSPDGSKLAFESERDGNREIYVMNAADGSGQTNLTSNGASDGKPAWSPDGQKLAFSSNRDGNLDVFVMNAADGSGQTNLTNNPALDDSPDWQPVAAPPPPPPPPPENKPPVPALTIATPTPAAGEPVEFDASGSSDPDGQIEAYEWDFDGDGQIDANTGDRPTADHVYPERGSQTVEVRVTDDDGATSALKQTFTVADPDPCEESRKLGPIHVVAPCIRRKGDRYIVEAGASGEISLNGITLVGEGNKARLVLDLGARTITTNVEFAVKLKNTPLGDITLYRNRFEGDAWQLPEIGAEGAQLEAPAGSFRVATFKAGAGCQSAERTACARLPGNFPLRGQIDLYVTKSFEAVLDGHAELDRPFTVRGNVRLIVDLDRGLHLDKLDFEISDANLGVFRLEELKFSYQAPPTDTWDASLRVVLPTPNRAGVAGEARFVGGEFSFAKAELTGVPIPISPGVFLDRLAGEFGLSPLRIGGGLGVRFGPATADGNFRYTGTDPAHLHVDGSFSLLGKELARAYFDYWSNGDLDFGGEFHYSVAILSVDGTVAGWYQDPRFQVEGSVNARVWKIQGGAKALVNNDWIAVCATIASVKIPFDGRISVSGKGALRLRDGHLEVGLGCDLGGYKIARLRASAGQAGERSFTLPTGLPSAGVELRSETEAPIVTLTAPGGESFTTPTEPDLVVGQGRVLRGRFTAVRTLPDHRLVIRVDKPLGGTWRITPAGDSPAITELGIARGLPDPRVRARVVGRGHKRELVYRIRRIPGQRVRFLEDGRDTTHVIGTTTRPRGSLRFTPTDGAGRRRRIVAAVEQDGVPRANLTVGRYTAPRPVRPGRPGRVRIRRRGSRAIVGWGSARRADSYSIFVAGSDGRRELHVTSTRRRRLVLQGVLPFERLTVTVRGEFGPAHRAGPSRRGQLKAKRGRRRTKG